MDPPQSPKDDMNPSDSLKEEFASRHGAKEEVDKPLSLTQENESSGQCSIREDENSSNGHVTPVFNLCYKTPGFTGTLPEGVSRRFVVPANPFVALQVLVNPYEVLSRIARQRRSIILRIKRARIARRRRVQIMQAKRNKSIKDGNRDAADSIMTARTTENKNIS